MPVKTSLPNLPPLPTNQQASKRSFVLGTRQVTRSKLNLPPLVIYQKLSTCDKEEDICQVFQKLSALCGNLQDPLKELLLRCAYEDQEKSYKVSYFDTFDTDSDLLQGAYCSPQPDHMPLIKRFLSNKIAKEHKAFGVYRRDAPLATIIARWTPNSMSAHYDRQSVIQELKKFGDIESVTPFGRQTVIVVFKEICSACKAVSAFPPECSEGGIRCFWHHKFMSKYKRRKFQKRRSFATLGAKVPSAR
ncbi:uncharacterized protein C6orf201 homolog [Lacerta agilis]|uniref:uncharacterized protein C6orf201 homolog n=1 Tax=Lacerta agilis TaxID=80427 RepID=UPI00141967D5|nr:uncharacterized protein C6orf201 homolog [Lacerta agilis]